MASTTRAQPHSDRALSILRVLLVVAVAESIVHYADNTVRFDDYVGPDPPAILRKLHEELGELEAEIEAGDRAKAREELGDLLFVCANLARKLDVDPEDALRSANAKFVRRFRFIERALASEGRAPEDAALAEMEGLWDQAKAAERT